MTNEDEAHQGLVDLLSPGMPFDNPIVRREIAGLLNAFPKQCKDHGDLLLGVNPVDHIDRWVEGVKDKRRINNVYVRGCLEQTPRVCQYCLCETGGYDFGIGGLKRVLRACSEALYDGYERGHLLTAEQYKHDVRYSLVQHPVAARAYFRTFAQGTIPLPEKPSPEQGYQRAHQRARDQIIEMRHQTAALAARGNLEAQYLLGCLLRPHSQALPADIGPAPLEQDSERPYQCTVYSKQDYRADFLMETNGVIDPRGRAIAAFEQASASTDKKLAARAHWNLALLGSEAGSEDQHAPSRMKRHLSMARTLDPQGFGQ